MDRPLDNSQLQKEVQEWAEKDGTRFVRRRLINNGVGRSTAEKLTLGKYPSEIQDLLGNAIRAALVQREQNKAS